MIYLCIHFIYIYIYKKLKNLKLLLEINEFICYRCLNILKLSINQSLYFDKKIFFIGKKN